MNKNYLIKTTKIFLILTIASLFFKVCYNNFRADLNYENALGALGDKDLSQALDYAETAIKQNPAEPNYYRVRARVYISNLLNQDATVSVLIKQLALNDIQKAYDLNPQNLVTVRNIIPLYYFLSAKDILKPVTSSNVDPQFLEITKSFYAKVKNISPNDAGVYALLAKYEKRLNLTNEYNASVEKIKSLRPDLLDWYEPFQ